MNQAYSRLSTTQSYHRLQVGFGGNKLIGFQPISYCAKCKKNTLGRDQINQLIYNFKLEVRRKNFLCHGSLEVGSKYRPEFPKDISAYGRDVFNHNCQSVCVKGSHCKL